MLARRLHATSLALLLSACGGHDAEPAAERAPEPESTTPPEATPPPVATPLPLGTLRIGPRLDRDHPEHALAELEPCPEVEGDVIVIDVRASAFVVATRAGDRRVAGDAIALRATLDEWRDGHPEAQVLVSPRIADEARTASAQAAAREAGFRAIQTCDAGANAGAGVLEPPGRTPSPSAGGYAHSPPPSVRHVPRVELEVATSGGGLEAELVRRTLHRHLNELRWCYERALQEQGDLQGEVDVALTIHPSGVVATAEVTRSTIDRDSLRECLRYAVLRWDFQAGDAPTSATLELTLHVTTESR